MHFFLNHLVTTLTTSTELKTITISISLLSKIVPQNKTVSQEKEDDPLLKNTHNPIVDFFKYNLQLQWTKHSNKLNQLVVNETINANNAEITERNI